MSPLPRTTPEPTHLHSTSSHASSHFTCFIQQSLPHHTLPTLPLEPADGPGIHTLLTLPTTTLLLLVTSSTNTHLLLLHLDSLFSFFSSSTKQEIFSIHPEALLTVALTFFVSSQLLLLNIQHVSQAPSIPHTLLLPGHPLPDIYLIAR